MTSNLFRRVAVFFVLCPAMLVRASADEKTAHDAKTLAAAVKPFVDKHTLAGAVMLVADNGTTSLHLLRMRSYAPLY